MFAKHGDRLRRTAGAFFCAALLSACGGGGNAAAPTPPTTQNDIRHVFIIMLENKSYSETFASNSAAPYLAQTLASRGALLSNYYGTGHVSLDNYISLISGESPTFQTDNDCTTGFDTIKQTGTAPQNQVQGTGCIYPATTLTLADQLAAANFTWKGYMDDMGNDPARESAACGHPVVGTIDETQKAEAPTAAVPAGDAYATRHDPFMYFHSIIDSAAACAQHVVNLDNALPRDLKSLSTTPNLTFITPNLCDDGHDSPCAIDGQKGGLPRIDTFLQKWVPLITASPAYQQDGLLIITFDESDYTTVAASGGTETISWSGKTCCNEHEGPNLGAFPQSSSVSVGSETINLVKTNYGGDLVGAVLLSKYIKPGTVSTTPYNHYSTLMSIENIFGLAHLGYAAAPGLTGFGSDVFTNL